MSLFLAALLASVLNTSCILTTNYSFTPRDAVTTDFPIANNSAISFDLHFDSTENRRRLEDSFKEGLVNLAFHEAVSDNDANSGSHVSVSVLPHKEKTSPSWKSFHLFISQFTLSIIPYYGEPVGPGPEFPKHSVAVNYKLYMDGTWKKDYPYTINIKVFSWILAPLAIPFLSSDREMRNALTGTARQFLRDAQRDGFL